LSASEELGCKLPVEVWHWGELTPAECDAAGAFGGAPDLFRCRDFRELLPFRIHGYQSLMAAVMCSSFREVLFFAADVVLLRDPAGRLGFESAAFRATGAVLWPDLYNFAHTEMDDHPEGVRQFAGDTRPQHVLWRLFDVERDPREAPHFFSQDTGLILLDKRRHWRALAVNWLMNLEQEPHRFFYTPAEGAGAPGGMGVLWGDKDTLRWSLLWARSPFHLVATPQDLLGSLPRDGGAFAPCGLALHAPGPDDGEGAGEAPLLALHQLGNCCEGATFDRCWGTLGTSQDFPCGHRLE